MKNCAKAIGTAKNKRGLLRSMRDLVQEAQKLQKIKDSGAIVVNNIDDLKEILKNGQ